MCRTNKIPYADGFRYLRWVIVVGNTRHIHKMEEVDRILVSTTF